MAEYSDIDNKMLALVFFICDRCNMKCKYCYNKFPRTGKDADLNMFFKFAEDISSWRQVEDLVILGGEPTLHSGLEEFVSKLCKLRDRIDNIILWTNFTKPLEYYVKLLDQGMKIAMSWHGLPDDPKNLEFIRKALALPKKYLETGQIIELDLMAEQDNFENFEMAYNLLHPKYKQLAYIWPVYTSDLVIGDYSRSQTSKFMKMSRELGRFIFQMKETSNGFGLETPAYNYQGWKCNAGLDYIYVHCNGAVYNCQSYYQFGVNPMFFLDQNLRFSPNLLSSCKCQVQSCRFADYQIKREKDASSSIID